MLRKLIQPHSLIVTILILTFIWVLDFIRLNLHFLDPFNYGLKDYEITDIVYSQLSDDKLVFEDKIVLVDVGKPDREVIARLINRFSEAGAKVIGLDILLEGRKGPRTDSLLQASIKKAGNVVVASRLYNYFESKSIFETELGSDTLFSNYGTMGYANFPANDTRTVRFFSPKEKILLGEVYAFSTSVAEKYDPVAVGRLFRRKKAIERINYLGNTNSFIHFDTETALNEEIELSAVMNDKIVLLGYIGDHSWSEPLLDRYFTPLNAKYTGRTIPDMYGVIIHANIIAMILNGNYIYQVHRWVSLLIAFIFLYLNVILIHWIYKRFHESFHGITRILQLTEFVFLFFLIAMLFHYFKVKFDFSLGILALVLAYDIVMIYESLIKSRLPFLKEL